MSQGEYAEFVDTQNVIITNVSDGITYKQAMTVMPFGVNHDMVEHHLTTEYVEKLASLDSVSAPITAILTQPDLAPLMTLSLVVNGKLPIKEWKINFVDFKDNDTHVVGKAKLFDFQILDRGEDIVLVFFRLEFESDIASSDKAVVKVVP
jgi:hypothetical protein